MRLLRYVQPPTQAGSGTTVLPAMFTPFKLLGASSSATLAGGAASGIAYAIVHEAADLSTVLGAWGVTGTATAAIDEKAVFSTAPVNALATTTEYLIGAGAVGVAATIPEDLWVMPGERVIFSAQGVDAADSITSLVWSILIP